MAYWTQIVANLQQHPAWFHYKAAQTLATAKAPSSVKFATNLSAVAVSSSMLSSALSIFHDGITNDSRRKHMKRHVRPYACTFPSCTSRHGSRSDWKRHEEIQHVIQESWLCTARLSDGSKCFTNFTSESALRNHLAVAHRIPTLQITSQLCEGMHLGKEAVGRFWCGFCQDIVSQEPQSGYDPKEIRMQHIGDHYDKEGIAE